MINRRRHTRAPLNSKVLSISQDTPKVNIIRDVSYSGIFMETVDLKNIGDMLYLIFPLHEADKTVQTYAKVVRRVEPVSDDDYTIPGMGLGFMDMPFESSILIENYVVMAKYAYEELLLLTTMKNPDIERIGQILKKLKLEDYNDFFELKDKVQKNCFALGIIKNSEE